jgi:hypothetical protein
VFGDDFGDRVAAEAGAVGVREQHLAASGRQPDVGLTGRVGGIVQV